MKQYIKISLLLLGISIMNSCKKDIAKKKAAIIYKFSANTQDSLYNFIEDLEKNKYNTEEAKEHNNWFFSYQRYDFMNENHTFLFNYCYNESLGCYKYNSLLENSNRFLKVKNKLYKIIIPADLHFTESKNRSSKLSGRAPGVFVIDNNGNIVH